MYIKMYVTEKEKKQLEQIHCLSSNGFALLISFAPAYHSMTRMESGATLPNLCFLLFFPYILHTDRYQCVPQSNTATAHGASNPMIPSGNLGSAACSGITALPGIKENLCLAGHHTQNKKTLHADLILAGITQLVTVVLADKIQHHEYIRSLKPLIA